MPTSERHYIQVILPLKLSWEPWYACGDELQPGRRVIVSFHRKKYVGVVHRCTASPGIDERKVVDVDEVLASLAPISSEEIKLWEFTSSYYLCTIGEVYKAAYPELKTRSEIEAASSIARLEGLIETKTALIEKIKARKRPNEKLIAEHEAILQRHRMALEALRSGAAAPKAAKGRPSRPLLLVAPQRTEQYIEAIRKAVQAGGTALVLVPEVAAGGALQKRLTDAFGPIFQIHNSLKTAVQRRKVMNSLRDAPGPQVILGTRSSLFLPYSNLALVIVDEEQDPRYKQQEPSPRYNGRDIALVLASIHGAEAILGTPCPSLESLHNASIGKYSLEFTPVQCNIEVIDIPTEKRKFGMKDAFSIKALEAMRQSEGPVTVVRCYETEDSVRGQLAAEEGQFNILTASAARNLTGISALTVVLNADSLFDREDFRADEKALQVLSDLAAKSESLVIQTPNAAHPVFALLQSGELPYSLLQERKDFNLPPFSRIVDILGLRGNLFRREILPKDRTLEAKKKELGEKYASSNIFDVDPL